MITEKEVKQYRDEMQLLQRKLKVMHLHLIDVEGKKKRKKRKQKNSLILGVIFAIMGFLWKVAIFIITRK
ncbi:MAG: hypothetical protein ACFB0B_15385 [Thermonemataceae bacterium]